MKSYYEQDGITIYHGDCRGVLPALATGPCFDLVFTSPPYNLGGRPWPHLGNWKPGDGAGSKSKWRNGSDAGAGVQYDGHEDVVPWPVYVSEQRETLRMCWQLVGAKGAIYYNHKPRVIGAKLWTPLELVPEGLTLRQIVVWGPCRRNEFQPDCVRANARMDHGARAGGVPVEKQRGIRCRRCLVRACRTKPASSAIPARATPSRNRDHWIEVAP
jgi:hypothetical protein